MTPRTQQALARLRDSRSALRQHLASPPTPPLELVLRPLAARHPWGLLAAGLLGGAALAALCLGGPGLMRRSRWWPLAGQFALRLAWRALSRPPSPPTLHPSSRHELRPPPQTPARRPGPASD